VRRWPDRLAPTGRRCWPPRPTWPGTAARQKCPAGQEPFSHQRPDASPAPLGLTSAYRPATGRSSFPLTAPSVDVWRRVGEPAGCTIYTVSCRRAPLDEAVHQCNWDLWCSLECTPACQAGGRGFKSRQVRGRIAQLVERAPEKCEVAGSTPAPTTAIRGLLRAAVTRAQSERPSPSVKCRGRALAVMTRRASEPTQQVPAAITPKLVRVLATSLVPQR
jgi:hypothetical protein